VNFLDLFRLGEVWAASTSGEHHAPSINQIWFPLVNFLIFAFLIKIYVLPLVRNYLRSRRAEVLDAIKAAAANKQRAEALVQDYKARLARLNEESLAILQGVHELGVSLVGLQVVHGSTVATNAVLERKGVCTAYITNQGLGDVLTIGRQARRELIVRDVDRAGNVTRGELFRCPHIQKYRRPVGAQPCHEVGRRDDRRSRDFAGSRDRLASRLRAGIGGRSVPRGAGTSGCQQHGRSHQHELDEARHIQPTPVSSFGGMGISAADGMPSTSNQRATSPPRRHTRTLGAALLDRTGTGRSGGSRCLRESLVEGLSSSDSRVPPRQTRD